MKRLFETLDKIENITLVWTILGLAFIGFVQVITRYVFNYSFTWFEELGRYLGVFVAFLGASMGVKTGSHFAMEIPMYIAYLPIPVFSGFIGVRFMIKAIGFSRAVLRPHSTPEVI
jgi:TRAP-type C4-dicarboxylate transport system permease small subunit